ncbi:MAG: cation acetate symporter [Phycisphaerales bacterium]|jgi:cation/acetate symporter|nr:cation acetate symporter [Phycisphaerales bacterium]MBT7171763.1 cation acetate symporter [Phycisphaerales bacterium]
MSLLTTSLLAEVQPIAVGIFAGFVLFVLWLSFFLGKKAKSAAGYFAGGGNIHWAVNGISFAGDYLSAASFLGICGMLATKGYDGFLYSIGYLAGWIVALFIVAEPMKRLGKYTFTDALDAKFNSKGIKLAAAISTLAVSIFYLIPQMVGAGTLVEPLLGLSHATGVIMVGAIVIFIVATAGMASTTYVQFLKGALLIVFSTVLTCCLLSRGLTTEPNQGGQVEFHQHTTLVGTLQDDKLTLADKTYKDPQIVKIPGKTPGEIKMQFVKLTKSIPATPAIAAKGDTPATPAVKASTKETWWLLTKDDTKTGSVHLDETQWATTKADDSQWINGLPASEDNQLRQGSNLIKIQGKTGKAATVESMNPASFLAIMADEGTVVRTWPKQALDTEKLGLSEKAITIYYPKELPGNKIMRPGLKFKVEGTWLQKMDFASLMLALFFGTAALPHILIRYYTVPSQACARKSTIVAIAAIGFFYVLTMYMGLGAMVSGVVNPADGNMSAPLLAKSFGVALFAIVSAIAFATVLGTVSGLIVASSGAVAHDLMDRWAGMKMTEKQKVMAGKLSAVGVGIVAIVLGIMFQGMNVSFLVGWAFAVAASANLPAILMLLFWKRTTAKGIVASITVGIISAIGWILLSPDMFVRYGMAREEAIVPFSNPGIVSISLSFITLVVVSLMTQGDNVKLEAAKAKAAAE